MSISKIGLESKPKCGEISIRVKSNHPLLKLCAQISWSDCYNLIEDDLKATTKGMWHVGRKLQVRLHLGAYFLRVLLNCSYRDFERHLRDNAAYQVFCGLGAITKWHCPDHTRLEQFSNRLSPETQRALANHLASLAVKKGFADPRHIDIDSTIQEANIRYPNDLNLLHRIAEKGKKIVDELKKQGDSLKDKLPKVDLMSIKRKVKSYLFNRTKWTDEEKATSQTSVLDETKAFIEPLLKHCETLIHEVKSRFSHHVRQGLNQLNQFAQDCFTQTEIFINTGKAVKNKILSLHQQKISCFKKRHRITVQFGRRIQLGRLKGDFIIVPDCSEVRAEDAKSVEALVKTHQSLFGKDKLESCSGDSGYYSKANELYLHEQKVSGIGLQKPGRVKKYACELSDAERLLLYKRRAGIEPLIGHCKRKGQLGRHRNNSDKSGLAAVYQSILGFNLRQLMNKAA